MFDDPSRPMPRPRLLSIGLVASRLAACAVDGPGDEAGLDGASDQTGPATGDGGDELEPSWRMLVDHGRWRADVDASEDPWPEHRPATVDCDGGWHRETDGIEIDTGACNYLLLQQPSPVAIEAGDPIRLRMWWQGLASLEPAQGHVAVLVDDELLWEELVPIPGPADVRSLEFPSPLSAPAGATITLHLHNHGYNTWHFHELAVLSGNDPSCKATPCD